MLISRIDWPQISEIIHKNTALAKPFTFADFSDEFRFAFRLLTAYKTESQNPNEAYGRHVMYSTPEFEVMMASWRPHAECAPHDHGFSTGCVLVLDGEFEEISYIQTADKGLVADLSTARRARKNQIIPVEGKTFHSMKSLGDLGITLHFYTPAIHNMKVLDLKNKRTLVVSEDCGAWVPQDTQKIIEVMPW